MSRQLGMGVMINMLTSNAETVNTLQAALGKEIARIAVEKDELRIEFTDTTGVRLWDDGQSCCESRYMNCDDDMVYHVGATIKGFELADGPTDETGEVKECQFLRVKTSRGIIVVANYNEHNGYYGGFSIEAAPLAAKGDGRG